MPLRVSEHDTDVIDPARKRSFLGSTSVEHDSES